MRHYELMVVLPPTVGDDGFPGAVAQVAQVIAGRGGQIEATLTNPPWGHRRLAYPINDVRDAYYAVVHLQLDPAQVVPLERELQLQEQVIRFILVRRDQLMRAEAKGAARRAAVPRPETGEAEGESDGGEGSE